MLTHWGYCSLALSHRYVGLYYVPPYGVFRRGKSDVWHCVHLCCFAPPFYLRCWYLDLFQKCMMLTPQIYTVTAKMETLKPWMAYVLNGYLSNEYTVIIVAFLSKLKNTCSYHLHQHMTRVGKIHWNESTQHLHLFFDYLLIYQNELTKITT